jgi:hypothetical protein
MRHTTGTRWIEAADARQVRLDVALATRRHPNDHRLAVKNVLRAVVIAIPFALAIIGGAAVVLTISGGPLAVDCAGFPAVACHPAQITSMLLSS